MSIYGGRRIPHYALIVCIHNLEVMDDLFSNCTILK